MSNLRRDVDAMLEQLDDWRSYASAAADEGKMNASVVPTLSAAIENMTKSRYFLPNAERMFARSPNAIF